MLKRNHLKLLSCVLVLAMTLSAFSGAAAFAEESAQSRTETGDGTPESPRLTADSSAVTDPVTGETTITVSFDKEWSDEGTIDIPDWVKADDTWISEDSTSEDNGVITKVQVSIDVQTNTTTYTRTVYGTDGQQTTETVACTRDKEGRITGYSTLKTTTTSATTEDSAPPENAEINPNGGWTSLDYEPPEKPTPANEPVYDADGKILSGDLVSEIYDDEGKLTGYTVITFENGKPVAYSNPVFGQYVATTTKVETLPDGKQLITKSRTNVISAESPTPGSLDAFKKMLIDAGQLTKEQAAQLSDGMALTATQAAIWYFGNSGSKFDEVSSADKALINGIYRYLIGMPGQEADINNTLLTKDDFAKDMSLTVSERNGADAQA